MAELLDVGGAEPAETEATFAVDGSAAAIALERTRSRRRNGGDEAAYRFLAAQEALIADQRRHLHVQFRHLGLKLWGERLKLTLQALAVAAGAAVVVALAAVVWDARQAHGVVIDAFSVPPALAERGLTGEAIAHRLMDDLSMMAETASPEEQSSVSAGWSKGLSVEIPDTGLSLGELDKWLRERLGRQTHVSGEVIAAPGGSLTLVARDGAHGLPVLSGEETQIADLIQQTAAVIYGRKQPVSYWQFLSHQGRWDEALAFVQPLTRSPDPKQRVFAFVVVGNILQIKAGFAPAAAAYRQALAVDPNANFALGNLADTLAAWGLAEEAYALAQRAVTAAEAVKPSPETSPQALRQRRDQLQENAARKVGDYPTASRLTRALGQQTLFAMTTTGNPYRALHAELQAKLHEPGAARSTLAAYLREASEGRFSMSADMAVRLETKDWKGLADVADRALTALQAMPDRGANIAAPRVGKAIALAHLGRFAEAHAVIDDTALDCQPCVSARGQVAELEGDPATADHWFGDAVRMAPSLPFAATDWGRALLDRGQYDRAIAQLAFAHDKSPDFADPLEIWGEAMLAKGDAAGAAAKFAAAAKLAPRWGRLHLNWGEALAKLGKPDEARAQWKAAAAMDLSAADRAALSAHGV